MAKRVKYKIGDVFMVPLNNRLYGAGRILKISKETVLIELYNMVAAVGVEKAENFVTESGEPLIIRWCYDTVIRSGRWPIVANIPIVGEVDMPYFWYYDIGYDKYFIQKGTDTFRCGGESVEIKEYEKDMYERAGIGYGESIERQYQEKMESKLMLADDQTL